MLDFQHALAQLLAEADRFDPVDHDGQVDVLRSLDENAAVAVLDLVELAFLAATERLRRKVADGGQHAADQVRVLGSCAIRARAIGAGGLAVQMQQQEAAVAMHEEELGHGERQRIPQRQLCLGYAGRTRAQPAEEVGRADGCPHPLVDRAGQVADRFRDRA